MNLLELVLADQRDLTAVERFSRYHDATPAPAQRYRELIPLSKPKPGQQYAFVVDLDRCSGCKACVSACHSLNGLDEDEMWRNVGAIHGSETPYLQTITASCHHCVDPACAAGCPVLAYEKDPATGIVHHLDDQCIGCQYCVLKCPYDVPKYSARKGIVRKCDMCASRLAVGEAPVCAQACPHEAIRIEIVDQQAVRETSTATAQLIPTAFPSNYTQPTSRYLSEKDIPEIRRVETQREHPHWPLVLMLLLTQTAAGIHLVNAFAPRPLYAIAAAATLFAGLGVSVLHLGRPLKAWRAFLGWRRSWMSREIIAFNAYAALAATLLIANTPALAVATAFVGCLGVFCSAMIYVDTRREGWAAKIVFPKFFGTQLNLGATVAGALSGWLLPAFAPGLATIATIVRTALYAMDAHRGPVLARSLLFFTSTFFSVLAILNFAALGHIFGTIACISTLASAVIERYLFFTATPAPRMFATP